MKDSKDTACKDSERKRQDRQYRINTEREKKSPTDRKKWKK